MRRRSFLGACQSHAWTADDATLEKLDELFEPFGWADAFEPRVLTGLSYKPFIGIKHHLVIANGDSDDAFLGSDDA